jgi:prevent-host-death family protein
MRTIVGVRELKTRLGTYLRLVREGATVVVTDRGRPVAELRAIAPEDRDEAEAIDDMVALGEATWKVREPVPTFRPIRAGGSPVSDTIRDEREDRV